MPRRHLAIIVLFIVAISLPYLLVHLQTPDGSRMTGHLAYSYDMDSPTYQSKMVNADGLHFQNLYNHLDQEGWTVFSLYALIGMLASLTGIDPVWTMHLVRVLFSLCFACATYLLLRTLRFDGPVLFSGFVLVLFGNTGEFGFYLASLAVLGGDQPFPKYIIEATPFGSAVFFPHYILALTLQVMAWVGGLRYREGAGPLTMVAVGIVLLLYSTIHPYSAVATGIAIGLFLSWSVIREEGWSWHRLYPLLYMGLVPLPYLVELYIEFHTNIVLVQWMGEAVLPVYIPQFVVLFGVWVILLAIALRSGGARESTRDIPLFFWMGTLVFLSLLPLSSSYRMLEGVGIPVMILLARWLSMSEAKATLRKGLVYLLLTGTTIALVFEPLWANPDVNTHWYRQDDLQDAYVWLAQHRESVDVLLGDYYDVQYAPAESGVLVFIGHNHETPQGTQRLALWDAFLEDPVKQHRSGWLERNHISHLLLKEETYEHLSAQVRGIGWTPVYRNDGYTVLAKEKTD